MSWLTSDLDLEDAQARGRWHRAGSDFLFLATGLSFGLLSIASWVSCLLCPLLPGRDRSTGRAGDELKRAPGMICQMSGEARESNE